MQGAAKKAMWALAIVVIASISATGGAAAATPTSVSTESVSAGEGMLSAAERARLFKSPSRSTKKIDPPKTTSTHGKKSSKSTSTRRR
jgi:hypothetical protein